MKGYTKIFGSILDSTVWVGTTKEVKLLWVTMLMKKDADQVVRASLAGLAKAAEITIEEAERAMEFLMSPEEQSTTKAEGGRRVIKREDGWLVVNGAKYRDMLSEEERREYNRKWMAEKRAILKQRRLMSGEEAYLKGVAAGTIDPDTGELIRTKEE